MFEQFISFCSFKFESIIILAGNHEYYSNVKDARSVGAINRYLRDIHIRFPKVKLLENKAISINGVRIVGATLWSHVPSHQSVEFALENCQDPSETVEAQMDDYNLIYVSEQDSSATADSFDGGGELEGGGRIRRARIADTNRWNALSRSFIEDEARAAKEARENLLVLTHHTPSFHGTSAPHYGTDPSGLSSAFSNNFDPLLQTGAVHTWCFGHTHYNSDQLRNGTRLATNQRGYDQRVDESYRPDFVVEVPREFGIRPAEEDGMWLRRVTELVMSPEFMRERPLPAPLLENLRICSLMGSVRQVRRAKFVSCSSVSRRCSSWASSATV